MPPTEVFMTYLTPLMNRRSSYSEDTPLSDLLTIKRPSKYIPKTTENASMALRDQQKAIPILNAGRSHLHRVFRVPTVPVASYL